MRNLLTLSACAAAVAGLSINASASLIAYEPFDYAPGGTVSGQSGGFGFTDAWGDAGTNENPGGGSIVSGSLSAAGLATSGNSALFTGENGVTRIYRSFPQVSGAAGTSTWFSFIGQRQGEALDTTVDGYAWGDNPWPRGANVALYRGVSSGVNGDERGFLGSPSNNQYEGWKLQSDDHNPTADSNVASTSFGDVAWVVLRIDHIGAATGAGADADNVYLFVNPDPNVEPTLGSADVTILGDGSDWGEVNAVRPWIGQTSSGRPFGVLAMDEIRIGTDFASMSAIPEPSVALLGGLGLLGLLRRRR